MDHGGWGGVSERTRCARRPRLGGARKVWLQAVVQGGRRGRCSLAQFLRLAPSGFVSSCLEGIPHKLHPELRLRWALVEDFPSPPLPSGVPRCWEPPFLAVCEAVRPRSPLASLSPAHSCVPRLPLGATRSTKVLGLHAPWPQHQRNPRPLRTFQKEPVGLRM